MTKDGVLNFDRELFYGSAKIVAFYSVSSMESSDNLLKKHGLSRIDLYMQMNSQKLFEDYEIQNEMTKMQSQITMDNNFIAGTNLEQMSEEVKAL